MSLADKSCCFKPSRWRLAKWHLQQYGIDGTWQDLWEIAQWVRMEPGYIAYPNVLQRVYPLGNRYFKALDHPEWAKWSQMVDSFKEVLSKHHQYIIRNIYMSRQQVEV